MDFYENRFVFSFSESIKNEGAEVIDNGVVEGAADLHALQNHNLLIALRDAARATPPNFPMSPVSCPRDHVVYQSPLLSTFQICLDFSRVLRSYFTKI